MVEDAVKRNYSGEWWLAGSDRRVGGELTTGPANLLRTVRPLQSAADHDDFTYATVLGESIGDRLTLLQCWSGRSTMGSLSGTGTVETQVGVVLAGARHLESEADQQFDRVRFRITALDEWADRKPFDHTDDWDSWNYTLRFTMPPALTASLPGARVTLRRSRQTTTSPTVCSIESFEQITIELDTPLPLDELRYQYVDPFVHLLDLATDHACEPVSIEVSNSRRDDDGLPSWFRVGYPDERGAADRRLPFPDEMPFRLADKDFSILIPRWFEVESTLRPVCDILFSLRDTSRYFIHNLAFSAASAAESMHSRLRGGKKHYAVRLAELVQDAGKPFLAYCGPDPSIWITRVKNYRNVVAHADDVNGEDQAVVVRLAQTLQVLLRMTLLCELGFTDDQRAKMIARVPHWKHLRDVLPREVPELFGASNP